jgi:hypothetical protein
MEFGNSTMFHIRSGISKYYQSSGFLALGYFCISINGKQYGVYREDATWLANSYDSAKYRISRRGQHVIPIDMMGAGSDVAQSYIDAIYSDRSSRVEFCGLTREAFVDGIYACDVQCAPDGDRAFDDGTHGLQFDLGDRVRLIFFKYNDQYQLQEDTFSDVILDGEVFYGTLASWVAWFERECRENGVRTGQP